MRVAAPVAILLALASPAIAAPAGDSVADHGAVGDGTTDDTAAFNRCLEENTVCWVDPAGIYSVGDVRMNSGNRLIGLGVVEYGDRTAATTAARPILVAKKGARNVLDVGAVRDGAAIEGLFIDCRDLSVNGISGGSFQLTVSDTTVVGCDAGLGDSGGVTYSGVARIVNSTFGGNRRGISNLIDSMIVNVDLANNLGDGIYLGAGANANAIVNCRFEWNQGFGLHTYGGTNANQVANSFFDRNFAGGIRIAGATGITIANAVLFRNGRNDIDGQNAQISISGSSNVSITGGLSAVGRDDGGGGPATPAYVFDYRGAPSRAVTIAGLVTSGRYDRETNRDGSYTVAPVRGTEPVVGYSVSGVNDIADTVPTAAGVEARAGGRAQATPLAATLSIVTSADTDDAAVKLAACTPGRRQTVANRAGNPITIFGTGGDRIGSEPASAGVALAAGSIATFVCTGDGLWMRQ